MTHARIAAQVEKLARDDARPDIAKAITEPECLHRAESPHERPVERDPITDLRLLIGHGSISDDRQELRKAHIEAARLDGAWGRF